MLGRVETLQNHSSYLLQPPLSMSLLGMSLNFTCCYLRLTAFSSFMFCCLFSRMPGKLVQTQHLLR